MKPIAHKITHQYQPTPTTCSPTALSMLLGSFDDIITPLDIEKNVPQTVNEKGEKMGTINQQLATWCINRGYDVDFYTFDCQIIDQSWSKLTKEKLLERLVLRKNGWVVPSMGADWTREYTQAYIDFIKNGGKLHIQKVVTSSLLYELLKTGPILPCISYSTLYGTSREVINQEGSKWDDVEGRSVNHSIVIYGHDSDGNFLVADPARKPGLHVIEPELMLGAISTAQLECDNLLFQISRS